jgi:hypothetical protein
VLSGRGLSVVSVVCCQVEVFIYYPFKVTLKNSNLGSFKNGAKVVVNLKLPRVSAMLGGIFKNSSSSIRL